MATKRVTIRAFRKFLYDNDALERYYAALRNARLGTTAQFFANNPPDTWLFSAFSWHDENDANGNDVNWVDLYNKWNNKVAMM